MQTCCHSKSNSSKQCLSGYCRTFTVNRFEEAIYLEEKKCTTLSTLQTGNCTLTHPETADWVIRRDSFSPGSASVARRKTRCNLWKRGNHHVWEPCLRQSLRHETTGCLLRVILPAQENTWWTCARTHAHPHTQQNIERERERQGTTWEVNQWKSIRRRSLDRIKSKNKNFKSKCWQKTQYFNLLNAVPKQVF